MHRLFRAISVCAFVGAATLGAACSGAGVATSIRYNEAYALMCAGFSVLMLVISLMRLRIDWRSWPFTVGIAVLTAMQGSWRPSAFDNGADCGEGLYDSSVMLLCVVFLGLVVQITRIFWLRQRQKLHGEPFGNVERTP